MHMKHFTVTQDIKALKRVLKVERRPGFLTRIWARINLLKRGGVA